MSDVTISNSPFHVTSQITYPYGVIDTSYTCDFHTGLDIVSKDINNKWIYSVSKGIVVEVNNNPLKSLGVNVVIKDIQENYWRYCHMQTSSVQVERNQTVDTNTVIGLMGSTGNVTGPHLHLEYSKTQAWMCSSFLNPCLFLQIPNEDDLIINYDGSITPEPPIPPTPTFTKVKHKFPWFLYYNKRRKDFK